jgi:hypothetical protein
MTPAPLRSEKLDLRLTPGAKRTLQRSAAAARRSFHPSPTDPLHLFVLLKDLQGAGLHRHPPGNP